MDLNLFWFFLVGSMLVGYAILDGFDLGVGTMHLILARTDEHRRVLLNAIGPVWDGNEVWLVVFGGALFAAFPEVYATAFSGFYLPFIFLLMALIFRAVAIEARSKMPGKLWRKGWDWAFFLASASSTFLFGVTIGNIIEGIPIDAEHVFRGSLFDLLHPYPILIGVFNLSMFAMHGTIYLNIKTEGDLQARVQRWVWRTIGFFSFMYLLTTIATLKLLPSAIVNYEHHPWVWGIVLLNVLAVLNIPRSVFHGKDILAFFSSAATIAALIALFGMAIFPNMIVSSTNHAFNLDIYNAASSQKTLGIMRIIAFIGMPFVLAYTAAVYWVFRGKVKMGKSSY